eukprot:scaffold19984_cov127-Isochrysis_galbana.AAC.12
MFATTELVGSSTFQRLRARLHTGAVPASASKRVLWLWQRGRAPQAFRLLHRELVVYIKILIGIAARAVAIAPSSWRVPTALQLWALHVVHVLM